MMRSLSRMSKDRVAHHQVPLIWQCSRTALLYKKGKEYEMKNWLQITVPSCTYPLFTAIITQWTQNQHGTNRL
jgi:hypothetical protein